MLVKAVGDKNMTVEEFGKVLLLEMQLCLLVKSEIQLHFCVCRLQKKNVPLSGTRL